MPGFYPANKVRPIVPILGPLNLLKEKAMQSSQGLAAISAPIAPDADGMYAETRETNYSTFFLVWGCKMQQTTLGGDLMLNQFG